MTDAEFTQQLLSLYRIEVFGQAMYQRLAGLAGDPQRRHKWASLAALEAQTRQRLASALQGAAVALPAAGGMHACGVVAGLLLALLPWRWAIYLLQAGARPALQTLENFAAQATGRDANLLDFLLRHERLQLEFAAQELAGRPQHSLDGVLALLAEPHASPAGRAQ